MVCEVWRGGVEEVRRMECVIENENPPSASGGETKIYQRLGA